MDHLNRIQPEAVAPLKAPRLLSGALIATAAAIIFALIPLKQDEVAAGPTAPDEQIVSEAETSSRKVLRNSKMSLKKILIRNSTN